MTNINTIVLIDDDYMSYYLTKRLLNKAGICENFLSASNGVEGIQVLMELNSNDLIGTDDLVVVLLDINMPIMTGWQFLEQYEELFSKLKFKTSIYILSSSINPDDKQKAKSFQSVKGFLNKPIDVNKLNIKN